MMWYMSCQNTASEWLFVKVKVGSLHAPYHMLWICMENTWKFRKNRVVFFNLVQVGWPLFNQRFFRMPLFFEGERKLVVNLGNLGGIL